MPAPASLRDLPRLEKLRRDPAHTDRVLVELQRLVRRRVAAGESTTISVVVREGAVVDVVEERRHRAEEFSAER